MRVLSTEEADIWVSPECLENHRIFVQDLDEEWDRITGVVNVPIEDKRQGVKDACQELVATLLNTLDELEREYIQLFIEKSDMPARYALLEAHGVEGRRGWFYGDGRRERSVQSWINGVDGKYGLLALCCCNTNSQTPHSKKSLLLVPDRSFTIGDLWVGTANMSILHPTLGELDHVIEYEFKQLKSSIR